jgi:hypothetical protein
MDEIITERSGSILREKRPPHFTGTTATAA